MGNSFLKSSLVLLSDLSIVSCSSNDFKLATSTIIPRWDKRLLFCLFILAMEVIYKDKHLKLLMVNSVLTGKILTS